MPTSYETPSKKTLFLFSNNAFYFRVYHRRLRVTSGSAKIDKEKEYFRSESVKILPVPHSKYYDCRLFSNQSFCESFNALTHIITPLFFC